MRDRLQEANAWILEVKERCQPRETLALALETSAIHIGRDSLPCPRSGVPTVRRKVKEKERSEEKSRSKSGEGNSVSPPLPTPSVTQALLALLQSGKALKIDLKKEVALLEHTLAAIERWDTQTSAALLSLDAMHLAPLVLGYRRLLERLPPCDIKAEGQVAAPAQMSDAVSSNSASPHDASIDSGWSRFPCTEGLCGPGTPLTASVSVSASAQSITTAAGLDMEESLWKSVLHFYAEMQLLSDQAAELGIWTPASSDVPLAGSAYFSFLQLELCQASIRWIDGARALMSFPLDLNYSLRVASGGREAKETRNKDKDKVIDAVAVSSRSDSVSGSEALSTIEKKKVSRKQKGEAPAIPCAEPSIAAEIMEPCAEPVLPSWGDCSRWVHLLDSSASKSLFYCNLSLDSYLTPLVGTSIFCSDLVKELVRDAEMYFKYIAHAMPSALSQPLESHKRSAVSGNQADRRMQSSSSFDSFYPSSSLLSRQHLNSFSAVLAPIAIAESEEEVSRKRKAPTSGVDAVDDSQSLSQSQSLSITAKSEEHVQWRHGPHGSDDKAVNSSEAREFDQQEEVLRGSSDMGSNGNLKKKKKVAEKVIEVIPVSVSDSNKRKRKKSAVAQEAEDLSLNSKTPAAPAPLAADDFQKPELSFTAPKGKRNSISKDTVGGSEQSVRKATPSSSYFRCIIDNLKVTNVDTQKKEESGSAADRARVLLPPALEALLDFWVRSLYLLEQRLDEARRWREGASDLMRSIGRPTAPSLKHIGTGLLDWEMRATELLLVGVQRGLKVAGRGALETHLQHINSWAASATAFLTDGSINGTQMSEVGEGPGQGMNYLTLQDFIRGGEQLQIERPFQIAELKSELRKAKNWLARYARTAPGSGVSAAVPTKEAGLELDALTAEAKESLKVDVREELEIISQATRRYCLCRQLYHGSMVGCDECDEWYHFQCVGLTQFQVEKADKYVCIRCCLKNSFCSTANLAAQITNRWSVPEEAQKAREARRVRVSCRT